MTRTIKIEVTFDESQLDEMLARLYFGKGEAPEVASLSDEQFEAFKAGLQATNFAEELVEGAGEDGDWLIDFMQQFE